MFAAELLCHTPGFAVKVVNLLDGINPAATDYAVHNRFNTGSNTGKAQLPFNKIADGDLVCGIICDRERVAFTKSGIR